ncbi:MAG: site-specific integrase [Rhodospirillaceae bacterium]|nr:site-specific integrase [Rhodospirillales bacterium]
MAAQTFAAFEGLRMSGDKEKGKLGGVEPNNELWVSEDMFGMGDDPAPTQPKPVAPPKDVTVPYMHALAEGAFRHMAVAALSRMEKDTARLEAERDYATKLAFERRAEPPPPAPEPKPKGEPWKSCLDAYKEYARLSVKTWQSYDQAFRRLEKAAGNKPIDAITPEDIRAFRELVITETKPRAGREITAAGTLQKQLSHLKAFFQWAKAEKGFIQSNPAEDITVPPSIRKDGAAITRNPYSKEELQAIFDAPVFTGCQSVSRRFAIHAMLTMRRFDQSTETGFSKNKARDWNDIFADFSKGRKPTGERMKAYRDDLADRATAWCQSNGVPLEISYKSNEALGKPAAEPTLPKWHFKKLEQTGEMPPDLAEVIQFRQQKKEAVQEATAAEAEIIDLTDPKAILADLTKDAKEASIQTLWRHTDAENAQRQHATAKPKGFWCRFNGKLRQWEEERERLDRAFAEATQTRAEAIEHLEKEKVRLRPEAERTAKENEEANRQELAAAKPAEAWKVNEELARQIKHEKAKEFLERPPPPKKTSPDEENAYKPKGMRM